jgi:hypothetical protein
MKKTKKAKKEETGTVAGKVLHLTKELWQAIDYERECRDHWIGRAQLVEDLLWRSSIIKKAAKILSLKRKKRDHGTRDERGNSHTI